MKRRGFFRWILSAVIPAITPRWARAQAVRLPESDLRELASIVLPAALGRSRTDQIADRFAEWIREYKAGAQMPSGYGFPRTQVVPASPAAHYAEQLSQLKAAATPAARRSLIEAAIADANVDRIPPRPNGRHVATDLMSFFYNSADGQDFLYGVAIKRDDCGRGLRNSGDRPAPLH